MEHDSIGGRKLVDMIVEVAYDRREASALGWFSLGERRSMKIGVADLPEVLECVPEVTDHFPCPGFAGEEL
jgi:hypothetical protein